MKIWIHLVGELVQVDAEEVVVAETAPLADEGYLGDSKIQQQFLRKRTVPKSFFGTESTGLRWKRFIQAPR